MYIIRLVAFSILYIVVNKNLFSQNQKDTTFQFLYYANKQDINELYIFDDDYSVAVTNNYLFLLNKHRLITDTIQLNKLEQFQNLIITGVHRFSYSTANSTAEYLIENQKFICAKAYYFFDFQKNNFSKNSCFQWIDLGASNLFVPTVIQNYIIGIKPVNHKQAKKYNIDYQIISLQDTLKFNLRLSDSTISNTGNNNYSLPTEYYYHDDQIFINCFQINALYIFNIVNNTLKYYSFPKSYSKNQSWRYMYDYQSKNEYVVKFKTNKTYEIFLFDANTGKLHFVKNLNYYPYSIVNNQVYTKKIIKNITYHYIYPFNIDKEQIINTLPEIIIKPRQ